MLNLWLDETPVLKIYQELELEEVLTNKVLQEAEASPHILLVLMKGLKHPLTVLPVLNILKLLSPLHHVVLKELKNAVARPADVIWLQSTLKVFLLNLLDEA